MLKVLKSFRTIFIEGEKPVKTGMLQPVFIMNLITECYTFGATGAITIIIFTEISDEDELRIFFSSILSVRIQPSTQF